MPVVLLIIDGLGVGAMPDAPGRDQGANTVTHVVPLSARIRYPALSRLGLFSVADGVVSGLEATRAALGYDGADSYQGHNMMWGIDTGPQSTATVREQGTAIQAHLGPYADRVRAVAGGGAFVLVDGVLIADNLEAEPGMAVSVAGCLDQVSWDVVLDVGQRVRRAVNNARVTAFGTPGISLDTVTTALFRHADGRTGVSAPRLNLYRPGYRVRHLGRRGDPQGGILGQVVGAGVPVALIGKAADLMASEVPAVRRPHVETEAVLADVNRTWSKMPGRSVIVATVQQTDLAGHAEDADQYRRELKRIDRWLDTRLRTWHPADRLIVTSDHGNDPDRGTGHTREYVPVLTWGLGTEPLEEMDSLRGVGQRVLSLLAIS